MGQQVSGWIMSMIMIMPMLVITRTRQGLVIMREERSSSVRSGPPWGKDLDFGFEGGLEAGT
jgi:hypothetical protein